MILKVTLLLLLMGQAPPTVEPGKTEEAATTTQTEQAQEGTVEGTEQITGEETGETGEAVPADSTAATPRRRLPGWANIAIIVGLIVVFYLLMILPQRRRQKKHQEMLKALNRGDKVVTNGGIHGTIAKVTENTFVIKTAGKTELEIDKSVVQQKK